MHIEKNFSDNLLGTLLGIKGKTKDTLKARLDMQDMNIRQELHPIEVGADKYKLTVARFTMSKDEKKDFLHVLKNVKVPDGYSSNISRCVLEKDGKISSLKSHDCHILMHQILPIAIRGLLPEDVCSAIVDICQFFKELCSKNNQVEDIERLNRKIVLTLCHLEMIFSQAFFDIMVHLPVHLAEEARIAGLVQYRQMFPFERYMFKLKGYIRCKSRPEGLIAEGFLAEECLMFCSMYLKGSHPAWTRPGRNEDGYVEEVTGSLYVFRHKGRFLGTPFVTHINVKDVEMAHRYVLFNCDELGEYRTLCQSVCTMMLGRRRKKPTPREVDNCLKNEFAKWFSGHVKTLRAGVSKEIIAFAHGPNDIGKRGNGYLINGYRFHTERLEQKRKTQNSRVFVSATTRGYSLSGDRNPTEDLLEYFGVLEDVIELDYYGAGKVVLFKCKWYDTVNRNTGIKTDPYGFTLVNSKRFIYKDEPFVLASQVEQLFFLDHPRDNGWRVIIRTRPRDFCEDVEEEDNEREEISSLSLSEPHVVQDAENIMGDITWAKNDIEAEIVEECPAKRSKNAQPRGQAIDRRTKRRRLETPLESGAKKQRLETFVDEEEEGEGDEDEVAEEDEIENENEEAESDSMSSD